MVKFLRIYTNQEKDSMAQLLRYTLRRKPIDLVDLLQEDWLFLLEEAIVSPDRIHLPDREGEQTVLLRQETSIGGIPGDNGRNDAADTSCALHVQIASSELSDREEQESKEHHEEQHKQNHCGSVRCDAHEQREHAPGQQVDAKAVVEILNWRTGLEVRLQETERIDEQGTEGHPEATI